VSTTTRTYGDPCGVARSLDVIGDRWALLVVRELLLGPKRFSDLIEGLTGASPNVVSQRLRDLVDHGVVRRHDLGPPTRVHLYELTDWGRELEPAVLHLGRWGSRAPGALPDRSLGVDSLVLGLKTAFAADRAGDRKATYELHIDDHVFTLRIAGGRLDARHGHPDTPPDAVITTGRRALTDAVQGHRSLDDLLDTGDLTVTGSRSAATLARSALLSPATDADRVV